MNYICNITLCTYSTYSKNQQNNLFTVKYNSDTSFRKGEYVYNPIKNYSGVSVEFRQIKAAMGVPKQQCCRVSGQIILPRSPEILSIPLCVIFRQVWLPSSLENQRKKIKVVVQYLIIPWPRQIALFNSSDIYLFINIQTCIDGELQLGDAFE